MESPVKKKVIYKFLTWCKFMSSITSTRYSKVLVFLKTFLARPSVWCSASAVSYCSHTRASGSRSLFSGIPTREQLLQSVSQRLLSSHGSTLDYPHTQQIISRRATWSTPRPSKIFLPTGRRPGLKAGWKRTQAPAAQCPVSA